MDGFFYNIETGEKSSLFDDLEWCIIPNVYKRKFLMTDDELIKSFIRDRLGNSYLTAMKWRFIVREKDKSYYEFTIPQIVGREHVSRRIAKRYIMLFNERHYRRTDYWGFPTINIEFVSNMLQNVIQEVSNESV